MLATKIIIHRNTFLDQVREAELLIRNCVKNINEMSRLKPLLLAAGLGSQSNEILEYLLTINNIYQTCILI